MRKPMASAILVMTIILEIALTTAPLAATPSWTDLSSRLRGWRTSSSRAEDLGPFDPLTGEVVLNNSDRALEPFYSGSAFYPNVVPRRRIRLRTASHPIADGYVDDWLPEYPGHGKDAIVRVPFTDLGKILQGVKLRRGTVPEAVPDLIVSEFTEVAATKSLTIQRPSAARTGDLLLIWHQPPRGNRTTIDGTEWTEIPVEETSDIQRYGIWYRRIGRNEPTSYTWASKSATNTTLRARTFLIRGAHPETPIDSWSGVRDDASGSSIVGTSINTQGTKRLLIGLFGSSSVDTNPSTPAGMTSIALDTVGSQRSAEQDLPDAGATGDKTSTFDIAGLARQAVLIAIRPPGGNPTLYQGQFANERITTVTGEVGLPASMIGNVGLGLVQLGPSEDFGEQRALQHLRRLEETETGGLFISRDGKLTFANRFAPIGGVTRSSVTQATFGDQVGEIGYTGVEFASMDEGLANSVEVVQREGLTARAEDTASQAKYGELERGARSEADRGVDAEDQAVRLAALLGDVNRLRVKALHFAVTAVNEAALLSLERHERVTVKWSPPGGGARINQEALITGIAHAQAADSLHMMTVRVSPTEANDIEENAVVLGEAKVTADQTGMANNTDLTGLSVAVNVAAGRRVRITGHVQLENNTAGAMPRVDVMEGATVLQFAQRVIGAVNTAETLIAQTPNLTPSAGAHTYKLQYKQTAGTGALRADSTRPAFILVEDLGAV